MPVSSKEFLDIQATVECRFTLKHISDMTITYSQMHHTDKYSQHSSDIVWVFVHQLSGCGFKTCCCNLKFRYCVCFEQGVPWHLSNYRVQFQSERHRWNDNNIQSHAQYRYVLIMQLNHLGSLAKSLRVQLQIKWL